MAQVMLHLLLMRSYFDNDGIKKPNGLVMLHVLHMSGIADKNKKPNDIVDATFAADYWYLCQTERERETGVRCIQGRRYKICF